MRAPQARDARQVARDGRRLARAAVAALLGALLVCALAPGASQAALSKRTWLRGVAVTEYFPVPERWFVGRPLALPGLDDPHRVDWLLSSRGVVMEGDGIALDGSFVHVEELGTGPWYTLAGRKTHLGSHGWTRGSGVWWGGGWRNRRGGVTFPLAGGGWSNGAGSARRFRPILGVTFAPGPSRALRYYRSLAVDPALIPLGSRVYIPAYRGDGHGGWFVAQDTGGAIAGRHVDVYRPPPASKDDSGRSSRGQHILVIPPRRHR